MKQAIVRFFLASLTAALAAPAAMAQDAKPGNAADGAKKAAMCIGCHGIVGYQATHPEVYRVPMIAGQNAKYIVAALAAYKKGDRRHPSMRAISGSLSDQDMADLAAHYEGLAKGVERVADAAPEPDAGVKELITKGACASCHGANFSKPIDPSYPKIAGQHADYLLNAMKSYKAKGPVHGRENAIMGAQMKAFDTKQLKAMAQYIGSLPGEMRTVPQEKFHQSAAAAK
jgi:cytochrome c553